MHILSRVGSGNDRDEPTTAPDTIPLLQHSWLDSQIGEGIFGHTTLRLCTMTMAACVELRACTLSPCRRVNKNGDLFYYERDMSALEAER